MLAPRGSSLGGWFVRPGILLLASVLTLLLPRTAAAQPREWRIADFKATVAVDAGAGIVVSERIAFTFSGAWNGVHRTIPIEYSGPNGTNYTLFLHVRSVTDDAGNALRYESSTAKGRRDLKIYIPDARDATRVVDITYSINNAIRFFDDHDELYWNVTGNEWPVPIAHASALVTLPIEAANKIRTDAYTGFFGSTASAATHAIEGNNATFETTQSLSAGEGLTIDVNLRKHVVAEPGTIARLGWFLGSNPVALLPLLTAVVMFGLWYRFGKDPDPGMSVTPQYKPPPDLSPAEVGALVDDSVDARDVTSTIVDLGVRGYLKISKVPRDYVLELRRVRENWGDDLRPHERLMLERLFPFHDQVQLSDLKDKFYTSLSAIESAIRSRLKVNGMYTLDPMMAFAYSFSAALFIGLVTGAVAYFGSLNLVVSPLVFAVSLLLSVGIWILFTRQMSAKSVLGAQTVVSILGFKEFVNRVDGDRLRHEPPDTFEKYLAYAMALGVERHWARAFEGIVHEPPTWYASASMDDRFDPFLFSGTMREMAGDMQRVFRSSPSQSSSGGSSSSSGSGGGGSSGGGFGGGGGSAF